MDNIHAIYYLYDIKHKLERNKFRDTISNKEIINDLNELLQQNIDVNQIFNNITLLSIAIETNRLSIIKYLSSLKHANINRTNIYKRNLHYHPLIFNINIKLGVNNIIKILKILIKCDYNLFTKHYSQYYLEWAYIYQQEYRLFSLNKSERRKIRYKLIPFLIKEMKNQKNRMFVILRRCIIFILIDIFSDIFILIKIKN